MNKMLALCSAFALVGCTQADVPTKTAEPASSAGETVAVAAPGGAYELDPQHASLIFKVDHIGMSNYTARFTDFDAELQFDPRRPEASSVTARVNPASLETDNPDPKIDFDGEIEGPGWLAAAQFPQITFRSTKIERTGPRNARITGDLSFRGVTRPIVLQARFNDGYAPNAVDPMGSRIGFSATGALNRSEFGMKTGLPPAGSKMGVGDQVQVIIEAEFVQPAPAAADARS